MGLRRTGSKVRRRWELAIEILQREMEIKEGVKYGSMDVPEWPTEIESHDTDVAIAEE